MTEDVCQNPESRGWTRREHTLSREHEKQAWELSRSMHGNVLTLYVPGMFVVDGKRGKYRAVSITGSGCELQCEHCRGTLLATMPPTPTPESLITAGLAAAERGDLGLLLSGGCDREGSLPWERFYEAIATLKSRTGLRITVHTGLITEQHAKAFKESGVDQALVDIICDDKTAVEVYHLPGAVNGIRRTLEALAKADLEIVPHIIFGIHFGEVRAEHRALDLIREYPGRKYVVVVLMPTRGTPMASISPPPADTVAAFIARARLSMPERLCSLGCARPRGHYRRNLDRLAVRAGVNSIALPSEAAVEEALDRGLAVEWRETCCSLE